MMIFDTVTDTSVLIRRRVLMMLISVHFPAAPLERYSLCTGDRGESPLFVCVVSCKDARLQVMMSQVCVDAAERCWLEAGRNIHLASSVPASSGIMLELLQEMLILDLMALGPAES